MDEVMTDAWDWMLGSLARMIFATTSVSACSVQYHSARRRLQVDTAFRHGLDAEGLIPVVAYEASFHMRGLMRRRYGSFCTFPGVRA